MTIANKITGNEAGNNIAAGDGKDTVDGGLGNDTVDGGIGDDVLNGRRRRRLHHRRLRQQQDQCRHGNDTVQSGLIGINAHDLISGFDGNAAGGQDFVSLTALFDSIGIAAPDRLAHVNIIDKGSMWRSASTPARRRAATEGFDLFVATLQTKDTIIQGRRHPCIGDLAART